MQPREVANFGIAEAPTLGAVEVAGLPLRTYLKAIVMPVIAMVFLNLWVFNINPSVTNIFEGEERILAANAFLLALPSITLIARKNARISTGIAASGFTALIAGLAVSIARFALTLKFHLFFNILFETGALVLVGVVVGIAASLLTTKGVQWFTHLQSKTHANSHTQKTIGKTS
ncbi:MAG: hypothetical protein HYV34_04965 [Candidatus Kerfeldbacteria bacterium]|nr:hypothetical protein [Candidatus Kerfeldbacteria bacterium]